ncbi:MULTISPECIES: methyltransferase domain-containing protein [Methylobacterium]|uniref:2-methoxy-6-polyprenyl-1,4-benzoquinol methylase, mitochondrial n=1 Tax=Methylobacterium thuringiense TaxID=1003091 RepID=A0ABQ4TFY3_9HYPH|nr:MULTISPECIES: methyltransferase domain-containing protein [Methylobacterium]TXN24861.1 methyltransferase domain-containing protein [Methylobacterium sp. WL9]GJE54314.1 2-methoxy-6-polyprenyl-1,4-benzoquinol methylase, mitochondrial [Methylobacterium thuringiense]
MHDVLSQQSRSLGDFADVDSADSEHFVAKLDEMQALPAFQDYKQIAFALLRLVPGASVADIGCGAGDDAGRLIALVQPSGSVTGFDLSETMLAQARARYGNIPGLSFAFGSADGMTAAEGRFDAVRADRVLIHVPDATQTLAEMVRATKPGGRVVVSEPDMPGCWMSSSDPELAQRVVHEIAQTCTSPFLARDLVALFKDAGLVDVTLTVSPVTAFEPGIVGKILDFAGIVRRLVESGAVTKEKATEWVAELEERGRTGRFVGGMSIMTVAGTKV